MTIAIYCIKHANSGRCYVGKSINVERRRWQHEHYLTKPKIVPKHTNRFLYAAVKKYGWSSFEFILLETFPTGTPDSHLSERELFFMDKLKSCESGFNLRRDSSTKMTVSDKTRALLSKNQTGKRNANYGNKWSDLQRKKMSEIAKRRHADLNVYGVEWRAKISIASSSLWADVEKKAQMANAVSESKKRYKFVQLDTLGVVLRIWDCVAEIIKENPSYKWQNIYAACNGSKPTYMGFIWKKVARDEH